MFPYVNGWVIRVLYDESDPLTALKILDRRRVYNALAYCVGDDSVVYRVVPGVEAPYSTNSCASFYPNFPSGKAGIST